MATKKKNDHVKEWIPLLKTSKAAGIEPNGEAFRTEWIDFERGIRVGNIEPHERITQILKYHVEKTYKTAFVMDRWGRGVYWQWICWLSKANRQAKPISRSINFGCAKLFISVDRKNRVFQSGLQVERGYSSNPANYSGNLLQEDWDWHRLLKGCRKNSPLDEELRRLLLKEGFRVDVGDWGNDLSLDKENFKSASQLRTIVQKMPGDRWGGFQLYYPMPEAEVKSCSGYELVKAIEGIFAEVIPAMNLCMQVNLESDQIFPRLGG